MQDPAQNEWHALAGEHLERVAEILAGIPTDLIQQVDAIGRFPVTLHPLPNLRPDQVMVEPVVDAKLD
jgi:hypothetical protein